MEAKVLHDWHGELDEGGQRIVKVTSTYISAVTVEPESHPANHADMCGIAVLIDPDIGTGTLFFN